MRNAILGNDLKLNANQELVFDLMQSFSQVITLGHGWSTCKGNAFAQVNPWCAVDFSFDIFLAQSSLGNSLIYCVRNFYNPGYPVEEVSVDSCPMEI